MKILENYMIEAIMYNLKLSDQSGKVTKKIIKYSPTIKKIHFQIPSNLIF